MQMLNRLISVYILQTLCVFQVMAAAPNLPTPNPPAKEANTVSIPKQSEQASNKARLALKLAVLSSRKALKAVENAHDFIRQTTPGTPGFYVGTNDQGYRYEGGWLKNLPNNIGYNGYGVLSWPNGNSYAGSFLKGHKNGYGVFTGGNGDTYQGAFVNGELEGYGRYIDTYGNRYDGEFHHNFREGYGIMVYQNGERYEGEWRGNEKHGYGVLFGTDGKIKYAGFW
jgi:hypothetical protein